jgi:cell division protein FtsI (penicillin-binding protein 3)
MLYNAVANEGRMMKPYLVNAVMRDGQELRRNEPVTLIPSICSPKTLARLKECLRGVVVEGTGSKLNNPDYTIAGKTGTALVANGTRGYADHIYQSSFAGYFPAEAPRYSCIVVIKNKPFATKFYGADVAGPVFREVADRLHALDTERLPAYTTAFRPDSASFLWTGWSKDFRKVYDMTPGVLNDSAGEARWSLLTNHAYHPTAEPLPIVSHQMPGVKGMGLKDALYLLENMNLKVVPRGRGKVKNQSIAPGTSVTKGQTVYLDMEDPLAMNDKPKTTGK